MSPSYLRFVVFLSRFRERMGGFVRAWISFSLLAVLITLAVIWYRVPTLESISHRAEYLVRLPDQSKAVLAMEVPSSVSQIDSHVLVTFSDKTAVEVVHVPEFVTTTQLYKFVQDAFPQRSIKSIERLDPELVNDDTFAIPATPEGMKRKMPNGFDLVFKPDTPVRDIDKVSVQYKAMLVEAREAIRGRVVLVSWLLCAVFVGIFALAAMLWTALVPANQPKSSSGALVPLDAYDMSVLNWLDAQASKNARP